MTSSQKLNIASLLSYTFLITILRAIRTPNDFAEAHWLLDYQFGFVKRGLIGEFLTILTDILSVPITANLILIMSSLAFLFFCLVILWISMRITQTMIMYPSMDVLFLSLIFLSSPFIVLSADLIGYYDNIIISLGILSSFLFIKGQSGYGACIQGIALLIHENALFLATGPFLLTWLLLKKTQRPVNNSVPSFLPLLLPLCVFMFISASQEWLVRENFAKLFTNHLSQFAFIEHDRDVLTPIWLTTSFSENYVAQSGHFWSRVISLDSYLLVLPSILIVLWFIIHVYQIHPNSLIFWAAIGICLAPQSMHLIAWDKTRIWTYSIVCAYLLLWIFSEIYPVSTERRANNILLYLIVILSNVLVSTPLMDQGVEHFTTSIRILLYIPVFIGSFFISHQRRKIFIEK